VTMRICGFLNEDYEVLADAFSSLLHDQQSDAPDRCGAFTTAEASAGRWRSEHQRQAHATSATHQKRFVARRRSNCLSEWQRRSGRSTPLAVRS